MKKQIANLVSDQKAMQELAASMLAEPASVTAFMTALAKNANPAFWFQLQQQFMQEHTQLITSRFFPASTGMSEESPAAKPDPRFSAPEWEQFPWFHWLRDAYLVNARLLNDAVHSADLDPASRERLAFSTKQLLDAMSPANFLATNPEAIKLAFESRGQSLSSGMLNMAEDMRKGYISLTDEKAFELGKNIAATPGEVIFENAVMQLVHYRPTTKKVHARPLLFIPPFVNKFYLMDLEPDNSFVRWTVEQGHQLFLTSFKNTTEAERHLTWNDYVRDGVIRAMAIVRDVTGQPDMNLLAFCTGGTLAATAFAPLIANGHKDWIKSLTLLATALEYSDVGEIGVYMETPYMRQRAQQLKGGGVMPARELSAAFSSLKPTDLVWSNVVNHYLKGKSPVPFGLLYWNSDPTSLPGPLYSWYLDHTYMGNKLVKAGASEVCGTGLDLGQIDVPTYAMGALEDHIVPWRGAYESVRYLGGNVRFCLGGGGHIAGTMNPATKNRRNFWVGVGGKLPADSEQWLANAKANKGSWWTDWAKWLKPFGGKLVASPRSIGSKRYQPIESAPGRYVRERSV